MRIHLVCQACHAAVRAPVESAGRSLPCPKCRNLVMVPEIDQDEPTAAQSPPTHAAGDPASTALGLAIGSMALGLVALAASTLPFTALLALTLGGTGLLMSLGGLWLRGANRHGVEIGLAAAGFFLCAAATLYSWSWYAVPSNSVVKPPLWDSLSPASKRR